MGRVTLGRVAGVFGIKGWVRLASQTRPADNILAYREWWVGEGDGAYRARVVQQRVQPNGLLVQITDAEGGVIEDRDRAQALVGRPVAVDREALPRLPEGEYYWIDLIGLSVVNEQGVSLGKVTDLTSNGAQDVLVVRDGEDERLIPFVHGPIIKAVEMDARRIVCDWQREY